MCRRHRILILGQITAMVLAVSALSSTVAHAWEVNVGGASVNEAELDATVEPGNFLVPELGLSIYCSGGTATATLETAESETLLVEGAVSFSGCTVDDFEETCTVHSAGSSNGVVKVKGGGEGQREEGETFAEFEGSNLSEIIMEGEECVWSEIEGVVSGAARLTLQNAETPEEAHTILIEGKGLKFGEETLLLHDGSESSAISSEAEAESGGFWSGLWLVVFGPPVVEDLADPVKFTGNETKTFGIYFNVPGTYEILEQTVTIGSEKFEFVFEKKSSDSCKNPIVVSSKQACLATLKSKGFAKGVTGEVQTKWHPTGTSLSRVVVTDLVME